MTEPFRVSCLIDRFWDPTVRRFSGTETGGDLLEITVQSAEDNSGKVIPVGVVLLDDNTLQSIPVEFIRRA